MSLPLIAGYIVRDEEDFLKLTLPKVAPHLNGIVAIDAMSTDGTVELLKAYGATVKQREWNGSFADARNACVELASSCYTNADFIMLDADEAILASDFGPLKAALSGLSENVAAILPRYEFVDDFFHFNPDFYPDFQGRCFKLPSKFHYFNKLHEFLMYEGASGPVFQTPNCVAIPYVHIFHYGKCKDRKKVWLKYENYYRTLDGRPMLEKVPDGTVIPESFSTGRRLEFHGERPL